MDPSGPPRILTPDQRLRVFISSARDELGAESAAARDAVEELHLIPVMTDLGVASQAARDVYRAYLEQSQVFIGIYGQSYGPLMPDMTISCLEDEYELAADKPRLLYIQRTAADRDERLDALIERFEAEDNASFVHFDDASDLRRLVSNDLGLLLSEHFLGGGGRTTTERRELRSSVPVPSSSLIGREKELREIAKLLAEGRLITLTGPGGTGKTRLSLEVVRRLEDPSWEGPWVVELAGLEDAQLVLTAIVQALGIVAQPARPAHEVLAEVIGDRKGLLVLDNCEHVIDAASEVASRLLMSCPNLTVLATSREPLKVRGEIVYPLSSLPITIQGADGGSIDGDAMRMFEARAAEVVSGFRLDDSNRDAVRSICAALDGLPLAIELAVPRLRTLSPTQLWERLDDRFSLLVHGPRDLPDRQRTLLATIDWSFDLLEEPEQELFKQLSVFRGGFELDAVERVSGLDGVEVLDLMEELVSKSLVTMESVAGDARFELLESLRAYGRLRLDPKDLNELQQRHLEWSESLGVSAEQRLRGPEAGYWLDRLDRERDNLRAALTFAIEERRHGVALLLSGSLGWFWYRRGYVSEGRYWLERALAAPDKPTREHSLALVALAGIEYLDGDLDAAARHASEAFAAAELAADTPLQARALLYSAYFHATLGQLDEAERLARSGGELAQQAGHRDIESETYTALGQLARVQGRPDEAETLFLRGAALAQDIGHLWHEGSSYWLAAKVALDRGDAAAALDRLRDALRLMVAEGDRTSTLVGLHTLASAVAMNGAPERGAMLIGAVAAAGDRIGFFPERMDPLDGTVTIERVRATLDEASYDDAYRRGRELSIGDALDLAGVEGARDRSDRTGW